MGKLWISPPALDPIPFVSPSRRGEAKGGMTVKRLFGAKWLYYLLALASLGLLLGASFKWHPF